MGATIDQIRIRTTSGTRRASKARARDLDPIRASPYRPAAFASAAREGLTEDRTRSRDQRAETSCTTGGTHRKEFRRRIKTRAVPPCAETVPMLFRALLASAQVQMRKIDGRQTLGQPAAPMPLDQPA